MYRSSEPSVYSENHITDNTNSKAMTKYIKNCHYIYKQCTKTQLYKT